MNSTIIKPLVNEKSTLLQKEDSYTFLVSKNSNKKELATLIAKQFNVEVLAVTTINTPGKVKSQRTRRGFYNTGDTKKAIVKIKKGQKIALFETAAADEKEVEVRTAEGEVIAKTSEKKNFLTGKKVKVEKINDQTKESIMTKEEGTQKSEKTSQKPKKKGGAK